MKQLRIMLIVHLLRRRNKYWKMPARGDLDHPKQNPPKASVESVIFSESIYRGTMLVGGPVAMSFPRFLQKILKFFIGQFLVIEWSFSANSRRGVLHEGKLTPKQLGFEIMHNYFEQFLVTALINIHHKIILPFFRWACKRVWRSKMLLLHEVRSTLLQCNFEFSVRASSFDI